MPLIRMVFDLVKWSLSRWWKMEGHYGRLKCLFKVMKLCQNLVRMSTWHVLQSVPWYHQLNVVSGDCRPESPTNQNV